MYYNYDGTSVAKIRRKCLFTFFMCFAYFFHLLSRKRERTKYKDQRKWPKCYANSSVVNNTQLTELLLVQRISLMMSTLSVSDPYENQRYQSNTENFGRAWAPAKLSKTFQKAYSKGVNQQETRIILLQKRLERSYIYFHAFRRTN